MCVCGACICSQCSNNVIENHSSVLFRALAAHTTIFSFAFKARDRISQKANFQILPSHSQTDNVNELFVITIMLFHVNIKHHLLSERFTRRNDKLVSVISIVFHFPSTLLHKSFWSFDSSCKWLHTPLQNFYHTTDSLSFCWFPPLPVLADYGQ